MSNLFTLVGHSMHEMQLLSTSAGSGSLSPRMKTTATTNAAKDIKHRVPHRVSVTSWDSDSDDWSDGEQQVII